MDFSSSASYRTLQEHRGYRHPFLFGIHYFGGVGDSPRTLAELAMSQLSAEIRRTEGWSTLYADPERRNACIEATIDRVWEVKTPSSTAEVKLSRKQILYVLDELEGYRKLGRKTCQVSCFERIWESDCLLNSDQSKALSLALDSLQHECTTDADGVTIHPIDPRLFCLVYDHTYATTVDGRPRLIPPPTKTDVYTISREFALLPAQVSVSSNGAPVKFLSYINNLHPRWHRDVYQGLESLLGAFIPLFENALTDLHRNNPLKQRIPGRCRYTIWDEPEPPEYSDDEAGWVNYHKEMRDWTLNRPIALPDVPESGSTGGLEARKHVVKLRNRGIQVIVGTSETTLVPGGPTFAHTSWQVEGLKTERIVACGYHILAAENITSTSLEFRMAVTYPRGFSAGDTGATLRTWGLRDGDSCHQYIGHVPIRNGLSIVFPNIYQHRQTAFELLDPSQKGHLKTIKFFLVDPDITPIVSTAQVAPQQYEWTSAALFESLSTRLPVELIQQILDNVEGLMTRGEAQEYKRRFEDVIDQFTQANNSYHFCIPFDIWNGPDMAQ